MHFIIAFFIFFIFISEKETWYHAFDAISIRAYLDGKMWLKCKRHNYCGWLDQIISIRWLINNHERPFMWSRFTLSGDGWLGVVCVICVICTCWQMNGNFLQSSLKDQYHTQVINILQTWDLVRNICGVLCPVRLRLHTAPPWTTSRSGCLQRW